MGNQPPPPPQNYYPPPPPPPTAAVQMPTAHVPPPQPMGSPGYQQPPMPIYSPHVQHSPFPPPPQAPIAMPTMPDMPSPAGSRESSRRRTITSNEYPVMHYHDGHGTQHYHTNSGHLAVGGTALGRSNSTSGVRGTRPAPVRLSTVPTMHGEKKYSVPMGHHRTLSTGGYEYYQGAPESQPHYAPLKVSYSPAFGSPGRSPGRGRYYANSGYSGSSGGSRSRSRSRTGQRVFMRPGASSAGDLAHAMQVMELEDNRGRAPQRQSAIIHQPPVIPASQLITVPAGAIPVAAPKVGMQTKIPKNLIHKQALEEKKYVFVEDTKYYIVKQELSNPEINAILLRSDHIKKEAAAAAAAARPQFYLANQLDQYGRVVGQVWMPVQQQQAQQPQQLQQQEEKSWQQKREEWEKEKEKHVRQQQEWAAKQRQQEEYFRAKMIEEEIDRELQQKKQEMMQKKFRMKP